MPDNDETYLLPKLTPHADRWPNGQLKKGANLGGGNTFARAQQAFKKTLVTCATEDDVKAVYASLLSAAKGGDVAACRLFLEHLVGRPSHSVELTGSDGGSLKLDLARLTTVILTALGPDSEARYKVAEAFSNMVSLN